MRRAFLVVLIIALLVALDALFNGYRVTEGIYRGIVEFGRLINRTVDQFF
jgi:hypothetical protein